jgi:hypothetical protein
MVSISRKGLVPFVFFLLTLAGLACEAQTTATPSAIDIPTLESTPTESVANTSTATLDPVEQRCQETQSWDEPKPRYVWINQVQEENRIPIRLVQGQFTTESTTLEFIVEHPNKDTPPDLQHRFNIIGGVQLEGVDWLSDPTAQVMWGCNGKELHIINGLGPVEQPEDGFRIEFPRIQMRTANFRVGTVSPGTPIASMETIEGPWVFQFVPGELNIDTGN